MKLAFFSDIHGNVEAFKAVIEDIRSKDIDFENVFCLGDSVGYGPRPNEVINLIRDLKITSVLGNYDSAVASNMSTPSRTNNAYDWTVAYLTPENKEFIRNFEDGISVVRNKKSFFLRHGSLFSNSEYIFEDDTQRQMDMAHYLDEDVIVMGHTHLPYAKEVNGKIFINTGSVGKPKDGDNRACYCVVNVEDEISVEFFRLDYDIDKVIEEINQSELPNTIGMLLKMGRG
ncbi:MAG: hypothetical protein ATN36_02930 [Epulopiscium sp. Nele67-Bin005]|nr:MAG: hypothetical protein ATN36_02930 [Epulopiscium sp. Nele67-Bin005]